ncbi:MAG: hypothetical protein J1E78_08400 [Muribaculaceae bacterium]|nr:hypothetical protein [Muribaculaceae bacterium]
MKKIYKLLAFSLLALGVASCAKEEIGGTAVQDMCGEWYVQVDGVDANGNVTMEDPFGVGIFPLFTYNTNANLPTEMYVDDDGNFWAFRVKVDVNYAAKTFSVSNAVDDYYGILVDVVNGSIVKDGAKSPAGYTADSISFMVAFEDDDYIGAGYWDYLWIHGYRRTGLDGGYD